MGAHRKTNQLPIRFKADELRRARKAARLQAKRLQRPVTPTEILRAGGMRLVEEILANDLIEPQPVHA